MFFLMSLGHVLLQQKTSVSNELPYILFFNQEKQLSLILSTVVMARTFYIPKNNRC